MVTRVNSASITGNATSSPATITIPAGTGIQAGDLIIISTNSGGVASPTVTVKDSVNNVNFTQLLQTLSLATSNRYLTSFYYQTPQAIADSSTITVTSSGATQVGGAVDIFRGCSGAVDQAVVGQTDAASNNPAAPALGANATAGALVMTLLDATTGTITAGSPFTTGSTDTTCRCGNGYVLAASGASTYASTWTLGTNGASGVQTVSFLAATAGFPPVPQSGLQALSRRSRRKPQQQIQGSVPAITIQASATTLPGTGTLNAPAVIQGVLGTTLGGAASLNAPAVIQGVLGTTLGGAASLNAPAVIQGDLGTSLPGAAALATAETLGVIETLAGSGSIASPDIIQGTGLTLPGAGSVGSAAGQGSGGGLGGQGSVPGPDVIQGVLGTSLAGAGSVTASGSNLGPTFSGPLHIILPGAWARLTTGAFTLTVPLPALSLAAMAGTSSTFTITLPKPALGWTGRDYHSVVQLKVPLPKTALAGKVTHNPLTIKIPVPAAAMAGKLVHDGPLTIQLGKHRSVPRPAIAERAVTETSNPGYTTVAAGQHAPSSRPVTGQATATGTADSAATPHGVSGQPRHPQVS